LLFLHSAFSYDNYVDTGAFSSMFHDKNANYPHLVHSVPTILDNPNFHLTMTRKAITGEAVAHATRRAHERLSEGEWTTMRQYRKDCGGGSLRDVATWYRAWHQEIKGRLDVQRRTLDPVELDFVKGELEKAKADLEAAEARHEGERRHLMLETARVRDELMSRYAPNARRAILANDACEPATHEERIYQSRAG
jgi:hypothetical protein